MGYIDIGLCKRVSSKLAKNYFGANPLHIRINCFQTNSMCSFVGIIVCLIQKLIPNHLLYILACLTSY